jgi:hypothetical protein
MRSIRTLTTLLTFLIIGSSLQMAIGAQPTQVSNNGLNVKVSPMYAPDMSNDKDCTEGSIGVSRVDGQAFSYNDVFDLRSTFPGSDGYPAYIFHTQFGMRAEDVLHMNVMGKKIVTMTPYSKEPPKTVALTFTLCTFDFTRWKNSQIPKVLNVEIEYFKDFSSSVAKIKIPVQILPRDSEAVLISELRKECGQDKIAKKFTYNMTVQQTNSPKKSGELVGISGTLFRHGFPSPFDEIALFIESKKYADPRIFVAKTQTDNMGQFRFSFPIVREKGANASDYVIVAYSRADPIGPIPGPFDEMAYGVTFLWEPTARYFQGTNDWIPAHSTLCKEKIDAYNSLLSSQQVKIFEDDRNRIFWFTAKSIYFGFRDKKTYSSQSDWNRKTGGSCFVSGYTTSTGKRVSGYSRRCR